MDMALPLALIQIEVRDNNTLVLALKRLEAAKQDGDTILCMLRDIGKGFHSDIESCFSHTLGSPFVSFPCDTNAEEELKNDFANIPWKIIRFSASTLEELIDQFPRACEFSEKIFHEADTFSDTFRPGLPVRLAVVAETPDDLKAKLQLAQNGALNAQGDLLAQKGILFGIAKPHRKIAFVFPGHGSNYPGMLRSLVERFPTARKILDQFNQVLNEMGFPGFEQLAWQEGSHEINAFQAAELALVTANALVFDTLRALKIRPDAISAHSFGEYGAMYAAGCWNYRELVQAATASSRAHLRCTSAQGAMLCTNLSEEDALKVCDRIGGDIYIANVNTPDQTVLAGKRPEIDRAEQWINAQAGLMARSIPVINAVHTVLMRDVCKPLLDGISAFGMLPPKVPLLSNAVNEYVTDPAQIRKNLGVQVMKPVQYIKLIQRLVSDGVTLFIECGPGRVLTKMNAKILQENADVAVIAADSKNNEGLFPLLCAKAAVELYDLGEETTSASNVPTPGISDPDSDPNSDPDCKEDRFQEIRKWGRQNRQHLIESAHHLADCGGLAETQRKTVFSSDHRTAIRAIADEIGLHPMTLEAVFGRPEEWAALEPLLEPVTNRTSRGFSSDSSQREFGVPVRNFPMIERLVSNSDPSKPGIVTGESMLFPASDPFLIHHRFRGRPLLPAAMTLELFAETVRKAYPDRTISALRNVDFLSGCSFPTNSPTLLRVHAETGGHRTTCRLVGPFYNLREQLLEKERVYATGIVELNGDVSGIEQTIFHDFQVTQSDPRHQIAYVDETSLMYHGPVFQQCTVAAFSRNLDAYGEIVAHSIERLAGDRPVGNWVIHPATVDACLYLCGVCAWIKTDGAIGLPKSIEALYPIRLPDPGEHCEAYSRIRSEGKNEIRFDILCLGEGKSPLFRIENYCCQIVPSSVRKQTTVPEHV